MKNLLLKIEYQGTRFKGWQRQPDVVTIEGVLSKTIQQICQYSTTVYGCSRTDAGVHALGQVATVLVPDSIPSSKLFRSINAMLPEDIAVVEMVKVPLDFSVRRNNTGKRYLYQILNAPVKKTFNREFYWWIRKPLDITRIKAASQDLLGKHDFSAFKGRDCRQTNQLKTIFNIQISDERHHDDGLIRFNIEGSGFLKNMVRIIVGTLVDIGKHRLAGSAITKALQSGQREDAGCTAPAKGLILESIYFDPDPFTLYREDLN